MVILVASRDAWAIRPFITDDARVVGKGLVQLESWWRRDKDTMQVWALPAFGPTDWLELSAGGVVGAAHFQSSPAFAASLPLFQGKLLLRPATPNGVPGFAVATGFIPPLGAGAFKTAGVQYYGYLAATESLFDQERMLVHVNVGVAGQAFFAAEPRATMTWGVGSQVRLVAQLHAVVELFSGDPYAGSSGAAVQGGFRYIFSDTVQLDGTVGGEIVGDTPLPPWASSGIRIVSPKLF